MNKKIIIMALIALIITLPATLNAGAISFSDEECFVESSWSPFYNANTILELLEQTPQYIRFKITLVGPNAHRVGGKEDQFKVLVKACEACTMFPVHLLAWGNVVGEVDVTVISDDRLEAVVKMPIQLLGDETAYSMSFYYCTRRPDRPFVTDTENLCSSFGAMPPAGCPSPIKLIPITIESYFFGASTDVVIEERLNGSVKLDIRINGPKISELFGKEYDLSVERTYENMTSLYHGPNVTVMQRPGEKSYLIQYKNEVLNHKVSGTSYKFIYENPEEDQRFEYKVENLCDFPELSMESFCYEPKIAPIEMQQVTPMIQTNE